MRCFIAADIDEGVRGALEELCQRVGDEAELKKGDVSWVKPENIHLTLKFLGEVKDRQVGDVCRAVKEAVESFGRFGLDIEGAGTFGGRSARVFWVGAGKGEKKLGELAGAIDKKMVELGWQEEKRAYSAHLTLCRVKKFEAGVKLARLAAEYRDFEAGSIVVDSVAVYESELTPTGAIYRVVDRYDLRQDA